MLTEALRGQYEPVTQERRPRATRVARPSGASAGDVRSSPSPPGCGNFFPLPESPGEITR